MGGKDEFISQVLQRTSTHDHINSGRPAKTYLHKLCADTGCGIEDQLEAMNDRCVCVCVCVREREREKERESMCRSSVYICTWMYVHSSIKRTGMLTDFDRKQNRKRRIS